MIIQLSLVADVVVIGNTSHLIIINVIFCIVVFLIIVIVLVLSSSKTSTVLQINQNGYIKDVVSRIQSKLLHLSVIMLLNIVQDLS